MRSTDSRCFQRDWVSRLLAAGLLGFSLALQATALFSQLTPDMLPAARVQLTMWLFMPVWLAVLCGCFLFASGRQAWLWLGLANGLLLCLLAVLRLL